MTAPSSGETVGPEFPPGVVGDMAAFFCGASPRPVREVGIVASLAWMAGVCGWSYTYSGTGLNLYLMLVAPSGRGKEMLHTGPALLNRALFAIPGHEPTPGMPFIPNAADFFCYDQFASGAALSNECSTHPNKSFVNLVGEWGHMLSDLAKCTGSKGNDHMRSYRRQLTSLFAKAEGGGISGGMKYADKSKNSIGIDGFALSIAGESTPGTLYDAVSESMLADGFLSRFLTVEYCGPRAPSNEQRNLVPPPVLVERLRAVLVQSLTLKANRQRCKVEHTDYAERLLHDFDKECDERINEASSEAVMQIHNRAHLKVFRIAALLAVADNPLEPTMTDEHVEWAVDLVRLDTKRFLSRLDAGDIGAGDDARQAKLLAIIKDYLLNKNLPDSYGVDPAMQRDHMVPRKYLQVRTARQSAFASHPLGAVKALNEAVKDLCDSGYLAEVDKIKVGESYGFQGRCYRVVNLPHATT